VWPKVYLPWKEISEKTLNSQVTRGSTQNLHFDHGIPFAKGGTSLAAANVRLLCAKPNLEKSDKILSIAPWIFAGVVAAHHVRINLDDMNF
jgi:5-methylcytosine-specific restriction endonuclease McrA